MHSPDQNVERNRQLLLERSIAGLEKYGVTTERGDLTLNQWLQHLLEELLDGANYIQAAMANNPALTDPPDATSLTLAYDYERLEYTNQRMTGMLLWVLYHHQGGSSRTGLAIRSALGIEEHVALSAEQVKHATNVARQCGVPDNADGPRSIGLPAKINPATHVTVSRDALKQVLNALANAPAHHIREMQATLRPTDMFPGNPINILIAEFNANADQIGGAE
ncbi:MAG: hypothetical protein ACKVK5_10530 [Pseudomonadales bacterium]